MKIIVVDDLRLFSDDERHHDIYYAVNSAEGLQLLELHASSVEEIWLDHDLGETDTVLPVINWIEEEFHTHKRLARLKAIRILTNNPVGYQKILALAKYTEILPTPKHSGIRETDER